MTEYPPQNKIDQVSKGNEERKAAQDTTISNAPRISCVNSLAIFFANAFFDETRTHLSSSVEDTYNSVRGVCEAEVKIADDWGSGTGCHGRGVEPTPPLPSSSLPADSTNKNKSIRY